MVKDMAETAAEVVGGVAGVAEKVSAEVAGQLPEDGRLRHAAVLVEHASKEVAEEARLAQDIIHKVVPSHDQPFLASLIFGRVKEATAKYFMNLFSTLANLTKHQEQQLISDVLQLMI